MGRASSMLVALFAIAAAGLCTANHNTNSRKSSQTPLDGISSKKTCTFRAYEIQRCEAQSTGPATFLQINEIIAADNTVKVDVRARRPRQEFNSYQRLQHDSAWEVVSLENGEALSITLDTDQSISFAYGNVEWTDRDGLVEGLNEEEEGWCEVRGWLEGADDLDCQDGQQTMPRKRIIECGFPCGESERMELK